MGESEELNRAEPQVGIRDRGWWRRRRLVSRLKRRLLARHIWVVRAGLILGVLAVLVGLGFGAMAVARWTGVDRYARLGRSFVFTPEGEVLTSEGRTNILVLGKAGEGHIAPNLTDTMILVSVSQGEEPRVVMISVPRDIWITDLRAKLNSVYYWGNYKKEGGGLVLAKSVVEEVLGEPVHYGVVIDFSGFTRLIDALGGVEVEVERSFVDERFPIPGKENDECGGDLEYSCRYETVKFEAGKQWMDGATALKFVRSRHSEDEEEGTDLARGERQQRVLLAVRERILSQETLMAPKKLMAIWRLAWEMVEMDMPEEAMASLARKVWEADGRMESYAVPEELLENPPISARYDNLYVFVPRIENEEGEEDWSEIRAWVDGVVP